MEKPENPPTTNAEWILKMDPKEILKRVATNKHVQQLIALTEEQEMNSSLISSQDLPMNASTDNHVKATSKKVATYKREPTALNDKEMNFSAVSSNQLPKNTAFSYTQAILPEATTNKHVQLVALAEEEMNSSMGSSKQPPKNESTFSSKEMKQILKEVATNKHVQQIISLIEEEEKSSMGSGFSNQSSNNKSKYSGNEIKGTLQELTTNKHVQRATLAEEEINAPVKSSDQLPKHPSTSSNKHTKDPFHRNKKKLRAALDKVTAKVNKLSELEADTCKDMTKPIFSSSGMQHPLNFLEDFKDYFAKLPTERQTLESIIGCLQGDAKEWALIKKDQWSHIVHFEKDFIKQYWGMSSQHALRRKIVNGSYSDEEGPMSKYFLCIISQTRWLPHKMTDDELVSDIMCHFPRHVQIAWYLSEKRTVIEAAEFLRKMDEIELLCALKEETKNKYKKTKYKLRTDENALSNIQSCDLDCDQNASKRIKY